VGLFLLGDFHIFGKKQNNMKKIYPFFLVCLCFSITKINAQTFTVGCPSSNTVLSCINSPITMTANAGATPYSYTWTIPGSTINGNYANVAIAGTWTVKGYNQTTSVTTQQTFAISQNVQQPTIVITPTVNNITCAGGSGCFTLTSNLGPNVVTNWFMMNGANKIYVGAAQGTINIFCAGSPGVYWGESMNLNTGCIATKSVQVTALVGVPQFTTTSPTNFTLGCGTTSITSMQVSSVITSPVPNVATNYTIMAPPVSSTPTTFGPNPNLNNITVPGTYVVYVKDLTNNCISSQSISVILNTVTPSVYYIQPLSVINCSNSSMVMTGISSNSNTTITWSVPPTPTLVPTQTVLINTNPAIPNSSVNVTSVGSHSLIIVDNNNQCRSTYTIQVIQDLRKPVFSITAQTNSVITCTNTDVVLYPVITPTLAVSLIPTYVWYTPTASVIAATSITTTAAGSHTAISTSATNGCTTQATFAVAVDNVVGAAGGSVGISCPVTTAAISPTITTSPFYITFSWSGAPGSITTPVNQSSIGINALGSYTCAMSNTVNGCTSTIVCVAVCNTGLNQLYFVQNAVSVFPNPSGGRLTVSLSALEPGAWIGIYDVQGKQQFESLLTAKETVLETQLPKGCYFYKITSGETVLKRDKLIIE
jgi:hypothetical protein